MATQYIHVKIGPVDGVYPVRELIATGLMHDMYEYQKDATTIAWVHRQWCTPCTADGKPLTQDGCASGDTIAADSQDTDWRKFLHDHWDTERNHCKVEYLEAFMVIFRRAAAAYINKKQAPKPVEPKEPQPVASVSFAEAVPQPKPIPKKPRYVQLSLFD